MTTNGTDYDFGTQAKTVVRGVAGATVLVPVTFLNAGMRSDVYILIWTNSLGWQQEFLPDTTQRISSLRYGIVFAPFTIPPGTPGGVENELSLSARSQGLPSLLQEETIRVLVVSGGELWLPTIFRNSSAAPGGQTPSDGEQVSFLPFIDR
jgi:hypothetical protein